MIIMKKGRMKRSYKSYLSERWDIFIAKSIEEVENIRATWEEMQSREPYPAPNADIDRYISVIAPRMDSVRPHVIIFSHKGKPQAMVIGRVEEAKLDCKIGYKVLFKPSLRHLFVVYKGVIGNLNDNSHIYEIIIQELLCELKKGEFDTVNLGHVDKRSELFRVVTKLPSFLCRGYFPKVERHWRMKIPASMDEFYRSCSKKHRANLKRYIRKLEKDFVGRVKTIVYSRKDEVEQAIQAAREISSKTYQHAFGVGFVDNSLTRSLLNTAADQGWLRASILYVDDKPCAFQFILVYGRICFLDQIGFDPEWGKYNVGTVLFLRVLETLCSDPNIDYMDFYFGDATYKKHYGDEFWHEASLSMFAPRFYPVFANLIQSASRGLSLALSVIAEKTSTLRRTKRIWRNRAQQSNVQKKN